MMNALKIVFAGTPEFAIPSLQALYDASHHLLAVYTQPDRPAGRGRKLQASSVKNWALAHQIPIFQPFNFKQEQDIQTLAALKPDLMVVIAYGLILPPKVLAIPRLGCINVHASLLPRWRGASPIQQALLHGDDKTGVTIMQMNAGMDTGDKLAEVSYAILPEDTAGSLQAKLAQLAVTPLLTTLQDLAIGQAKPVPQAEQLVSYASKIKKEDAAINWQQSAQDIVNQIRAFNPWPVAYTQAGEERWRIHQAHRVAHTGSEKPGTVMAIDKQGILVATGNQALMIEVLQFPGSKVMPVSAWLNAGRSQHYLHMILQ